MNSICKKSNERFCLFPIQYQNIWENHYKKQLSAFWTRDEVDFSQDYKDYSTLSKDVQHVIKMILAFFSNSDGLVNFNIQNVFLNEITVNEIRTTYQFQIMMENIHNEVYSISLDTIIRDEIEKTDLYNSIKTIPIIKEISEWALEKSTKEYYSLSEKLITFSFVEGVLFSGCFALIYWLKLTMGSGTNIMQGFIKSNELISRDEGMHYDFAIEIYNMLEDKAPNYLITKTILEGLSLAKKFNEQILKLKFENMNVEKLNQYSEYLTDRLFVQIGMAKMFNKEGPFHFMQSIGMYQKTNFHESRVTEYQKPKHFDDEPVKFLDDF